MVDFIACTKRKRVVHQVMEDAPFLLYNFTKLNGHCMVATNSLTN